MATIAKGTNKNREALRLVDKGAHWEVHVRKGHYEGGRTVYKWCAIRSDRATPESRATSWRMTEETARKVFGDRAVWLDWSAVQDVP